MLKRNTAQETLGTKLKKLSQCPEFIFMTLVQIVLQDLQNTKWKSKCINQLQTHTAHDCGCTEWSAKAEPLGEITEVLFSPAQLCFPEAESLDYEK